MSDNTPNPRLKKWLEQNEEGRYAPSRHINSTEQANKQVIYHVIQNEAAKPYVGFWRRVFARIIDWLIIYSTAWIVYFILYYRIIEATKTVSIIPLLVPFLMWFFYYTILPTTRLKGTIGKLAVGAVIIDKNGRQLTYSHSVGRFLASILSWIFFIGYIMVASSPKKRGLHDQIADTYVVNKSE